MNSRLDLDALTCSLSVKRNNRPIHIPGSRLAYFIIFFNRKQNISDFVQDYKIKAFFFTYCLPLFHSNLPLWIGELFLNLDNQIFLS